MTNRKHERASSKSMFIVRTELRSHALDLSIGARLSLNRDVVRKIGARLIRGLSMGGAVGIAIAVCSIPGVVAHLLAGAI